MAANRPKRHKPVEAPVEHVNDNWTLKEKRRLQRALLKYSPKQLDCISRVIETKKAIEVRAYLDKMEEKLKELAENQPKEALEQWCTLGSDLISCEVKDYSEALSEVMSVAAHLEEHPESTSENKVPDYASIYKYIAAVLHGGDLPFLGTLESAIVLDLMNGLLDTLRTHDTTKQQEIMLQKYQLFTSKIDLNNTMLHVERCRKAINNDFSDFKEEEVRQESSSKTTSPDLDLSSQSLNTQSASNGSNKNTPSQNDLSIKSSPVTSPVTSKSGKGGVGKRKKSSEFVEADIKKSKLQHKSSGETEKERNMKSDHMTSSSGKQNVITHFQNNFSNVNNVTRESQPGTSSMNSAESRENDPCRKKESIPKKPALFTLNPFCIPIDMLKFKQLVPTEVTFKPVVRTQQMVQRIIPRKMTKSKIPQETREEIEIICVDVKQDIIRREKFVSVSCEDADKGESKDK